MKSILILSIICVFGCSGDKFTTSEFGSPIDHSMEGSFEGTGGSKDFVENGRVDNLGGSDSEEPNNTGGRPEPDDMNDTSMGGKPDNLPVEYEIRVDFDKEFLSGDTGYKYQYVIAVCDEGYTITESEVSINFIYYSGDSMMINNLSPDAEAQTNDEYQDLFTDPSHPLGLDEYESTSIGEPCRDCGDRNWAYAETAGGSAYNTPNSWYEYNTSFMEVTCRLTN